MTIYRNPSPSDKPKRRMVSGFFAFCAVGICALAHHGVLGPLNREMMSLTAFIFLVILVGRIILTELGVRRRD